MGISEQGVLSIIKKASFGLIVLAALLFLVSFSSDNWASTNHNARRKDHVGLWQKCTSAMLPGGGRRQVCDIFINMFTEDWVRVAQAFMTMALFSMFGTVAAIAACVFVPNFNANLKVLLACFGGSFFTVLLTVIGMISFASNYQQYFTKFDKAYIASVAATRIEVASLSWSYYLGLVAAVMTLIAPFLILPEDLPVIRSSLEPEPKPKAYKVATLSTSHSIEDITHAESDV